MDKSTIKDALKKVLAEKGNYTSLYSLENDAPIKREIKRIKIVSKTPPKQLVTKKDVESAQEVTKVETKKAIKTEVETITKQLDLDLTEKARLIKGEIQKDIVQSVTALVGTLAKELTAKLPTEMVMTEAQRQSIVDETALLVESQITSILAEYVAEIEAQSIPGLSEYVTSFLPDLTALQVDWSQIRNVPNLGGTNTNVVRQIVTEALANVSGGSGHTIEDEGTPLTQRTKLNFVGAGVTVTDDAGDDTTVVTIPAGGDVSSVNTRTGAVVGLAENSDLVAHVDDVANPHAVTKEQVGLSDVPNTDFTASIAAKQDTLVSATNIKTINGNNVLGAGDIEIAAGLSQPQVLTRTLGS